MNKTSLQISLHETSMVCGRSFEAYVNVFLVYILSNMLWELKEPQLLPCYILKVKIVRIFLISKFWFQLLQSDNCILKIDTTSYWMIVKSVVSLHTAKIGL